MVPRPPTNREVGIVGTLLPSTSLDHATVIPSGSHDVVLIPGIAAVRIARSAPAVESLPRRTALLEPLAEAALPFATPTPLSQVVSTSHWTAAAVSWIPGGYAPRGNGGPATLRNVLEALAEVDLAPLIDLLDVPHAYAGRERWEELILTEAVPRLPPRLRDSAVRRTAAVLALDPVPARLVHGDLTGENMHWSLDGQVVGVLDWDLAHPFDPPSTSLAWPIGTAGPLSGKRSTQRPTPELEPGTARSPWSRSSSTSSTTPIPTQSPNVSDASSVGWIPTDSAEDACSRGTESKAVDMLGPCGASVEIVKSPEANRP